MDMIKFIKDELNLEAKAIREVADRIDSKIEDTIDLLFNCKGKVVVTGIGKAGIIGRKIASTLASTGTTAIFLHAAEGIHGDLGLLDDNDVVIAVSNSGNTNELTSIIPYIKFRKIPIIALTGNLKSQLAKNATVTIDCFVPKEYEPFGRVPTSSTTVALAVGDAITVALLKKRNFNEDDFAQFHPGGTIGKKLICKIEDLMHSGKENPIVHDNAKMNKAIIEMTSKGLGCTNVINADGKLVGIVTDGDLRRMIEKGITDLNTIVTDVMISNPRSMHPQELAVDALNLMEDNKITMLPIVDENNNPVGMLHMHDLINAGVVG
ncbi:MAG: KpsF/GutQ family sugar-phosphate isomerase [Candidatus Cloacimonetes bacterium]|jgi:arabinose-5-phosphate isomerase|nr:KpsF/GutQ family sugar-phosphate isomerase [Candidatus Cloacimonadota bacterium]